MVKRLGVVIEVMLLKVSTMEERQAQLEENLYHSGYLPREVTTNPVWVVENHPDASYGQGNASRDVTSTVSCADRHDASTNSSGKDDDSVDESEDVEIERLIQTCVHQM